MKRTKTTIAILTIGLTMAISAVAFAHDGYGRHMRGYGGYMMGSEYEAGHMMGYGPGYGPNMRVYGAWDSLSDEDAAKLEATRERFIKETKGLRNEIDDTRIALRSEMITTNPNEDKVTDLQKQLSGLQAEFDQKALHHQLEMGKLMPEGYKGRALRSGFCW